MNSALTSHESGTWLFHITLDGRRNGGGERVPGGDHEGWTRARRWEKARGGEEGRGGKSAWIRAESDIKYIRIFSRDSPRAGYGPSESWISFWWVFPFRLLLHFNPPPKTHSSIAAIEYQCKRSRLPCGFFTSAFCPSRDRSRRRRRPVPRDTLSRTLSKLFLRMRRRGCGFFESASIAARIEIFVSYVFCPMVVLSSST